MFELEFVKDGTPSDKYYGKVNKDFGTRSPKIVARDE